MKQSEPTPSEIRSAERLAILSSCCGFPGEVVLTDSAVILLFAGALGAGEMLALLTTSFLPFFNGLCMIPMAALVMRCGHRMVILRVLTLATLMFFLAAAAPWFGEGAMAVLTGAVVVFSFALSGFVAGWYPMLDTFLAPGERTAFFSRMRFRHQLISVVFLTVAGMVLGPEPPVGRMQMVLFAAALLFCGRGMAIARIPEFPVRRTGRFGFREGLARAAGNRKLTGFSLYLFLLNSCTFGTVPLMMLYLKNGLHAPDNVVVYISAASLAGMLFGYLGIGTVERCVGRRWIFPLFHLLYVVLGGVLCLIHGGGTAVWIFSGGLLCAYSFLLAGSSILASSEMMALATPGNKVMAMAFSGTFSYGATGLARILPSLLLGSGMLAESWVFHGIPFRSWQTLLLLSAASTLLFSVFLFLVPAVFSSGEVPDRRNGTPCRTKGTTEWKGRI